MTRYSHLCKCEYTLPFLNFKYLSMPVLEHWLLSLLTVITLLIDTVNMRCNKQCKSVIFVYEYAGISWNMRWDIRNAEQCSGIVFDIITESVLWWCRQLGTCCSTVGFQWVFGSSVYWEGDAFPCQPSYRLDNYIHQHQPCIMDTWQRWMGEHNLGIL